jgi:cytochrome c oxidase subunit IV
MSGGHVLSVKLYAVIFAALIALTLTTTGVAFINLGANLNAVIALAIAVLKALLVILYFMHARYSSRLTWVFAAAGFFWLMILIGGTMDDVLTRNWFTNIR